MGMRTAIERAAAAVCGLLLVACGPTAEGPSAASSSPPTAAASATMAPAALRCAPGPEVGLPSEDRTPGWPTGIQERLRVDRRAVERYGRRHPDQFAGVGFGDDPVTVWVAFTGDLDRHCAALRDLVDHPERLEVVRRGSTVAERQRIVRELERLVRPGGPVVELGGGGRDSVYVGLTADQEDLAAELVARWGDAVEVMVGALPYPPAELPSGSVCPDLDPRAWPAGVRATVTPATDVITPGETTRGTVTIRNDSDAPYHLEAGQTAIGLLYDPGATGPGATRPVGAFVGALGDVGVDVRIPPAGQHALDVIIDAGSCDPQRGYVVPPGAYEVRAWLTGDPSSALLTEPAPVRVVAPDD